ncbi:MAG: hypothetical protein IKX19_10280, partial [Clostridia bacterium]|nr:hypothetical protein [Clostridia bacterium]
LFAITGRVPAMKSDSSEPSGHEIVIGRTGRRDFTDLAENDMVISLEDGTLYICGGNENTTSAACGLFCSEILGVDAGRYTGGSVIRVRAGTDMRSQAAFARYAAEGVEPTDYLRDNLSTFLGTDETPCFSDPETAEKLYETIAGTPHRSGEEVFIICNRPDFCGCEKCGEKTSAFL